MDLVVAKLLDAESSPEVRRSQGGRGFAWPISIEQVGKTLRQDLP